MTEAEWLDCTDVTRQNRFLLEKGNGRKLQLFLCACCRRAYGLLPDEDRNRVIRMAGYYLPEPDVDVGNVWDSLGQTLDVAGRFADGVATDGERRNAADAARDISQHFGNIAAGAPMQGQDPNYDDAAVKLGSDAASAADCAAWVIPSAAELAVRVFATSLAFDSEAYYAAAEGDPGISVRHPHMVARRSERTEQWKLLQEIFGNPYRHVTLDANWRTSTVVSIAQGIYDERAFDRLPILADALQDSGCEQQDILNHCRSDGPHVRGCWVVDLLLGKE